MAVQPNKARQPKKLRSLKSRQDGRRPRGAQSWKTGEKTRYLTVATVNNKKIMEQIYWSINATYRSLFHLSASFRTALEMIPVASMYLSTHRFTHVLSELLTELPGLGMHLVKHLSLTVCMHSVGEE